MRPITYKAYNHLTNQIVPVTEINTMIPNMTFINDHYQENLWSVMQSTGLNDSSNQEIFEGDIISHNNQSYVVSWIYPTTGFHPFADLLFNPSTTLIIGNIFTCTTLPPCKLD